MELPWNCLRVISGKGTLTPKPQTLNPKPSTLGHPESEKPQTPPARATAFGPGSALEAARLVPPALLWLSCRRRLAAPNSGAHGLEECDAASPCRESGPRPRVESPFSSFLFSFKENMYFIQQVKEPHMMGEFILFYFILFFRGGKYRK